MIIIDNHIVSDHIRDIPFCCNLKKCRGACCIEGDAGAPLDVDEISIIEDDIEAIEQYMTEKGIAVIKNYGVFDYDAAGELVTPLVNDRECAFVNFDSWGIAYCAIEKAFEEGKTSLKKPVSCHLYPIRITEHANYDAVNYHKWDICKHALVSGKRKGIPLYVFCKDALIRKYGKEWYMELSREIEKD